MTVSRWGNSLDQGFTMIPNVLLDNQEKLGISDDELLFIIKVMRHHESFKLHDNQIDKDLCSKSLQRRRNSLKEKGYLETTVYKYQDKDGTWRTDGILYDFSGLSLALASLDKKIMPPSGQNCPKKEPEKSVQHNTNYNTTIEEYRKEFKNRYKKDYELSKEEELLYYNSSEDFKKAIPYIFDYTDEYKESESLQKEVIPRLMFFMKVDFRRQQLIKYAQQMEFIKDLEETSKEKIKKLNQ